MSDCLEVETLKALGTVAATVQGISFASQIKFGQYTLDENKEFFESLLPAVVTKKQVTSNLATLTFSYLPPYQVGQALNIALTVPDAVIDGCKQIVSIDTVALTVTLAVTGADEPLTTVTGSVTAAPIIVINPVQRTGGVDPQPLSKNTFTVTAEVYFGYANNIPYTYFEIQNLVFPLMDTWKLSEEYAGVIESAPTQDGPKTVTTAATGIIGMYEITLFFSEGSNGP